MEEKENLSSDLYRKRKPFVAFFFSLFMPGIGQFYNGQLTKSIILITSWLMRLLVYYLSGIVNTFKGLLVILIFDMLFIIYNAIDAAIIAFKSKNYQLKPYNKWYFYLIIIVFLNLLYPISKNFRYSYYESYRISSMSMENTLLKGDIVICNKRYYNRNKIKRNDIVVVKHKQTDKNVVYRVAGLPNDKIEILDKNLYVNEKINNHETIKLIDSRIIPRESGKLSWDDDFIGSKDNFGPITVPENQYFVLGDNLDVSADSRYYGCVQRDRVIGKLLYIYFSYGTAPINDLMEYANLNSNRKNEFRKSRIGKRIE